MSTHDRIHELLDTIDRKEQPVLLAIVQSLRDTAGIEPRGTMTVLELIAALREALPYRDPGTTPVIIRSRTHEWRIDRVSRELSGVTITITANDGPQNEWRGDDDAPRDADR